MTLLLAACSTSGGSSASTTSSRAAEGAVPDLPASESCGETLDSFRTDLTTSGNRASAGRIDLLASNLTDVPLDEKPVWVVADDGAGSW